MSSNIEIAKKVVNDLHDGWGATTKQDHTFYSTSCKSTPHGTPSPFALAIQKKCEHKAGPANDL